jgi:hypothetical protein
VARCELPFEWPDDQPTLLEVLPNSPMETSKTLFEMPLERCLEKTYEPAPSGLLGRTPENPFNTSLDKSTANQLENNAGGNLDQNLAQNPEEKNSGKISEKDLENKTLKGYVNPIHGTTPADNKNWATSRLARTLMHIRVGDAWDNMICLEIGSSREVSNFFSRVSRQLGVLIEYLSILLPGNIAKLDSYIIRISWGEQKTFESFLNILLKEIMRLGVTRPVRFVLTGTVTVES